MTELVTFWRTAEARVGESSWLRSASCDWSRDNVQCGSKHSNPHALWMDDPCSVLHSSVRGEIAGQPIIIGGHSRESDKSISLAEKA